MCWPDFCATNSLVRTILACLCQVQRLLAADRGWGGASAHLEAEGCQIPGSSRWVLTSMQGHCERVPSHALATHRDPRRGLGRA